VIERKAKAPKADGNIFQMIIDVGA